MSLLTEANEVIWKVKSVVGVDPSSSAFIWKSGGSHAYKITEDDTRVQYKKRKGECDSEEISEDPRMSSSY